MQFASLSSSSLSVWVWFPFFASLQEQTDALAFLDLLFSPESRLMAAFRKNLGTPNPIYSEEILQSMVGMYMC